MTTYAEAKRDLESNTIARLYFLLGAEEFLARRLSNQIIESALSGGMKDFNFVELDPPSTDPSTFLQEVNSYPLGAVRRVVLIRQISSLSPSTQDALQNFLEDIPDFLTLILTADRFDRRKTLYKAISQAGVVVDLNPLRPAEVKAWIRDMLRERGKRVSQQLVDYIFELTGNDLSEVSNEINNLLEYVGERDTITRDDIDNLVASRRREPVYKLTECVAERDLLNAWFVLRELLAEGEQELRILWHLDFTVKRLLRAKCMLEEGVAEDTVVRNLQVKPFLKSRFLRQARSFSLSELRQMYRTIVEWDNKFKSTSRWHPEIDLELLVRDLCTTQEH